MFRKALYFAEKAFDAYNKGGANHLFSKSKGYIFYRIRRSIGDLIQRVLLFRPSLPPFSVNYRSRTVRFGYRDKYIYNDVSSNILPKSTEIVVEAGVHEGKDTAMFGKLADQVVAFEPSPRNHSIAKKNLSRFDNIRLINEGLWNEKDEIEIRYGANGGEDGFLEPDFDTGKVGEAIPVNTLEKYVEQLDIGSVDFLKIEAEGAEPEIVEGLGELDIENIVINADEERDGEPTGKEVMELLQPKGYNLVAIKRGHILFFTSNPVTHRAFQPQLK